MWLKCGWNALKRADRTLIFPFAKALAGCLCPMFGRPLFLLPYLPAIVGRAALRCKDSKEDSEKIVDENVCAQRFGAAVIGSFLWWVAFF
ncbi:MAG: hypothetical protein ACI83P_001398 [Janthinobacterium sp.]|jgi:hypothetical protein